MPAQQAATHRGLSIFISHSSKDADLALALIDLLKAGLALTADQIRCSSVDGYRLPVGVNTEDKLREEVNAAKVVVGLITPKSLSSVGSARCGRQQRLNQIPQSIGGEAPESKEAKECSWIEHPNTDGNSFPVSATGKEWGFVRLV